MSTGAIRRFHHDGRRRRPTATFVPGEVYEDVSPEVKDAFRTAHPGRP